MGGLPTALSKQVREISCAPSSTILLQMTEHTRQTVHFSGQAAFELGCGFWPLQHVLYSCACCTHFSRPRPTRVLIDAVLRCLGQFLPASLFSLCTRLPSMKWQWPQKEYGQVPCHGALRRKHGEYLSASCTSAVEEWTAELSPKLSFAAAGIPLMDRPHAAVLLCLATFTLPMPLARPSSTLVMAKRLLRSGIHPGRPPGAPSISRVAIHTDLQYVVRLPACNSLNDTLSYFFSSRRGPRLVAEAFPLAAVVIAFAGAALDVARRS